MPFNGIVRAIVPVMTYDKGDAPDFLNLIVTALTAYSRLLILEPSREIEKRSSYREFELSRVKL